MAEPFAQGFGDTARAKNERMNGEALRKADDRTPMTFRQWCGEELKPALAG